jgi:hypothetical protein
MAADVTSKRVFAKDLEDLKSQKTTFFIVTAVKISNLTKLSLIVKLSTGKAKEYLQDLSLHYPSPFLLTSPL